jgi:LysR family glycine cleavage system transcriptional activator
MYREGIDRPPPLPPLSALRAFEAAARLSSFTRAAAELCVTQTAISHQVKQLEAHLGVPLFRREPRRITLTPEGIAWASELRDIFARLHDANRRLRARTRRREVAVSVIPSFAARWLVPRLGRFLEQHGDIDVRISASADLVDFAVEPIDVGIRYGRGSYPGLAVEKLADDAFVVVCTPQLKRRLTEPSDLRRHVLLRDDEEGAWEKWLETNRVRGVSASRGTVLTDSSMLVAAAVQGSGVALARWSLTKGDLDAGRLVLPFPDIKPMPTGRSYYVVAPKEHLSRRDVASFVAWLRNESAELAGLRAE